MSFEILGVDLYHILSWFIVYSFMGMDLGKLLRISQSKKWVNRGFVSRTVCNNLWSGGGDRLRDPYVRWQETSWNSILQGWQSLRFWNT